MAPKDVLKKYYRIADTDSGGARKLIRQLNYKEDSYLLQCIAQTYFDESLFKEDGSYRTLFKGRKLKLAEKYIIKAFTIDPDHGDVLWTLGKVRNAFGQTDLAIYCFERIVELGAHNLQNGKYKNGLGYARVKVNDSKFQLYRLYHDKRDFIRSNMYLAMYKRGLKKGIQTIYNPLEKFLMH